MATKITATFNDDGESTVRTLTLPHDVSDRVGELIGLGLLAELDSPNVFKNPAELDIAVHRDGGSPSLACEYAVGDTIEVVERLGRNFGPPVGHRAAVVEVSDFRTLCIPWDDEGHDGFWLSYDQVRHVDEPETEPTPDYQIGDTVDVSPSCAWSTGGRGTVVELGTKPAPDLHVSPSIWSAPTIAPDGTKTFTAPGLTCIEHPPTSEDVSPSWTITSDFTASDMAADGRTRVAHDLRAFVASAHWTEDPIRGIALSTGDADKLLSRSERYLTSAAALRDAIDLLNRVRRDPGCQTAHEIEALVNRCRAALEDA